MLTPISIARLAPMTVLRVTKIQPSLFFLHDHDDPIIAYYKCFRYENPYLLEYHGEWIMHEYNLHESFVLPNCFDSN